MSRVARRRFLAALGSASFAAALELSPRRASAMGRTPQGGRVTLHVPWPTTSLDPHDLADPAAALFAAALADPLYGMDLATSAPYPSLASLPTREGAATVIRLREGLRTARGAPLDARDLCASVERARVRGAAALLVGVPRPTPRRGDLLVAEFGEADPTQLARALASPLTALLPRAFDPGAPDGTGAFRADVTAGGIGLTRNLNAARGPAFLDAIDVAPALDLKTSLREFEAEHDDIGWLGMGLHDGRKGAMRIDLGRAAWVVLVTSAEVGAFGLPGVAQRLVDAIPAERLAPLGLGAAPLPGVPSSPVRAQSSAPALLSDASWGGAEAELLVDAASPHLVEIACGLATLLSRPGHEITALPIARAELARRKARGKAPLTLELVRALGPSPLHTLLSLASAEDLSRARDLARSPPRLAPGTPARALTGALRVGVLGEVRIEGGAAPDIVFARHPSGEGWDLGATYRKLPHR
jgi:peptide/nickel transport system substrate-binding protein